MFQYLREIIYLLGSDRRLLPWMVALFLLSSVLDLVGLGLVVPYFYLILGMPLAGSRSADILGRLGLHDVGQEQLLLILGGMLVGVFLLKTILGLWVNRCVLRFSQNQQTRLRNVLMASYQSMPYAEYLRRNSSEYVHSIQTLTLHYANAVVTPMLRIIGDGIVALAILGFLARSNVIALALLIAMFGAVVGGYHYIFRANLKQYGVQANMASKQVVKAVHEGLEGLKEIRVLGKESYFHDMLNIGSKTYATNYVQSQIITTAPRYLLEFILIAFVVALVWMTLQLGGDLQAMAPVLALFGMASLRLLPMIGVFSSGLLQIRFHRNSVAQLYSDLRHVSSYLPSDVLVVPRQASLAGVPSDFRCLRLDGVAFRYPSVEKPALADISLEIRAGESIGLIGASGSGKTTLVDVLLGMLTPQQGEIYYNDIALQAQMRLWRRQVAYLPQQVFLTDNTLRSNVALGEPDSAIDDDKLMRALEHARLGSLVSQLPNGVQTVLGERGVRLSGGQRQRVALARAFYYGRNVLVMDEATSALDNETEREIVEEMLRLKGQKTMIVIAHRLTTVRHCDRIYRLDNGKIVEVGTPEEMLG